MFELCLGFLIQLLFDEGNFPGFYTVYRTMRSYPRKIAGNLLGYISEVDEATIQRDDYYQRGDYRGMSGIELTYEEVLRGEKGLKVNVVDVHGITQGSYQDGEADLQPIPGTAITTSLDADLQALGEELMRDKVGSIIAIEPATGEILVMVSSPGYDPDELVGRDRGNNYIKLLRNPRHPLFNRGVMSRYPPGSTFKLVNGLIALQEGVITPSQRYPCHGGYTIGRGVKCHNHPSPVSLQQAVQMSCNTYFCYALRNILDNNRYASTKDAFDVWNDYVYSFGFGRSLGSDLAGELSGFVPTRATYDRIYHGRWNSLTVISLSIGQGELGCTPLQMANLAAILANRGYYYTPHIVRHIDGRDSLDARFYEKHYTKVDPSHFGIVVEGMYDAVHKAGGTGLAIAFGGGTIVDICKVLALDIPGKVLDVYTGEVPPKKIKKLVYACLDPDPAKRPSAQQVAEIASRRDRKHVTALVVGGFFVFGTVTAILFFQNRPETVDEFTQLCNRGDSIINIECQDAGSLSLVDRATSECRLFEAVAFYEKALRQETDDYKRRKQVEKRTWNIKEVILPMLEHYEGICDTLRIAEEDTVPLRIEEFMAKKERVSNEIKSKIVDL